MTGVQTCALPISGGYRFACYITPFPSMAIGGQGFDRHGRLTERFLRCSTPGRHPAEERDTPPPRPTMNHTSASLGAGGKRE